MGSHFQTHADHLAPPKKGGADRRGDTKEDKREGRERERGKEGRTFCSLVAGLELSSSVKSAGWPLGPSGDAVLSSVSRNACVSAVSLAILIIAKTPGHRFSKGAGAISATDAH